LGPFVLKQRLPPIVLFLKIVGRIEPAKVLVRSLLVDVVSVGKARFDIISV
jgi:hypothetical protein